MIKILKCEICGKECKNESSLKSHYSKSHEDNILIDNSLKCKNPNCNNSIIKKYIENYGKRYYYNKNKNSTYCGSKCMLEFNPRQKYEQQLKCPICGKDIVNSKLLDRHLKRCKKRECEYCGTIFFTAKEYYEHLKIHNKRHVRKPIGEGYHLCVICGKKINHIKYNDGSFEPSKITCSQECANIQIVKTRTKRHNNTQKFKCPACKYTIDSKEKLDLHFNTVHKKEDYNFECGICGAQFIIKTTYCNHLKKCHQDKIILKKYICKNDKCKHEFYIKTIDNYEIEKNTGFCCEHCCRSKISSISSSKFWNSEKGQQAKDKIVSNFNGNKWYKYIDKHGNIHKCQGSYELIFAYILDVILNVEFITHTGSFYYYDENNIKRKYFPDFYIKSKNLYVDTKSVFLMNLSSYKIKSVREYNNINLLIATPKIIVAMSGKKIHIDKLIKEIKNKLLIKD